MWALIRRRQHLEAESLEISLQKLMIKCGALKDQPRIKDIFIVHINNITFIITDVN